MTLFSAYLLGLVFIIILLFTITRKLTQNNRILTEIAELLGSRDPNIVNPFMIRCPHCGMKNFHEQLTCKGCLHQLRPEAA